MDPIVTRRIEFWRQNLHDHSPSLQHRHESYALRACHLAVDAARVGTYGVGALLFDGAGRVIVEGHNRVRVGGFQSDLHAEMVVMNAYEATGRPREEARECTLVTSLEPCPMCMARLIVAGIGTVLYLADDYVGGMVSRLHNLPPTFRNIIQSQGQVWETADCSEELRAVAHGIWMESREHISRGRSVLMGSGAKRIAAL